MNPTLCTHPHEHQRVSVSHKLREIDHECGLCGHVETQTLGTVAIKTRLSVQRPGRVATDLW